MSKGNPREEINHKDTKTTKEGCKKKETGEMREKIIALRAIILMIAVWLFFSYRSLQSDVLSRILPTQTSIFSGPVDQDVIYKLQQPKWNGQISREQAIGLAELYCSGISAGG